MQDGLSHLQFKECDYFVEYLLTVTSKTDHKLEFWVICRINDF